MKTSDDIKDLCVKIKKAYYAGSEIPIVCVRRIKEWLNSKDKEEYDSEYWELKCICLEVECKYLKSECEDWQSECRHLNGECEYLQHEVNDLKE